MRTPCGPRGVSVITMSGLLASVLLGSFRS
jgi:hypothetical protein